MINYLHKCVLEHAGIRAISGHTEYCMDDRGVLPSCEGHTVVVVAHLSDEQEGVINDYNHAANGFGSIEVMEDAFPGVEVEEA